MHGADLVGVGIITIVLLTTPALCRAGPSTGVNQGELQDFNWPDRLSAEAQGEGCWLGINVLNWKREHYRVSSRPLGGSLVSMNVSSPSMHGRSPLKLLPSADPDRGNTCPAPRTYSKGGIRGIRTCMLGLIAQAAHHSQPAPDGGQVISPQYK